MITAVKAQYTRPWDPDSIIKDKKAEEALERSKALSSLDMRKRFAMTSFSKKSPITSPMVSSRIRPATSIQKRVFSSRK